MKKLYCSKCGRVLDVELSGAENTDWCTKYDNKTGERLYVRHYRCPKSHWYNAHTNYYGYTIVGEGERNEYR